MPRRLVGGRRKTQKGEKDADGKTHFAYMADDTRAVFAFMTTSVYF